MTDSPSAELIASHAANLASTLNRIALEADKEENIRVAVERHLSALASDAGIRLEGQHEFTVASGRVDSLYRRVIIEYKNPNSPSSAIGRTLDAGGTRRVVDQIKSRFADLTRDYGEGSHSLLGVGLDGRRFVFVRSVDGSWSVQPPVEVNAFTCETFLWALFNLGTGGTPYFAQYLAKDFGSNSEVAQRGVPALYEAICTTGAPKAQTLFNQWQMLFSEACGYEASAASPAIADLAQTYGVDTADALPAELVFAVQTYFAIFMKLIAAQVMSHYHKLPSPLEALSTAGSSAALRRKATELEAGGLFRQLGVTNFLEGDLFAWYVDGWSDQVASTLREMSTKLLGYNPATLAEDPLGSRDLLKKLYHQLFPKSMRHSLGEYYTPDWLADWVLDQAKCEGDPSQRILDPACGSGTFLVLAIARARFEHKHNRQEYAYDEQHLLSLILENVVGFDLNPVAVMAARTNYLIAIRDLLSLGSHIEIPVYLCDSVALPAEYADLFSGSALELRTAIGRIKVPREITASRGLIAAYAEQLEFCVVNHFTPDQFMQRCEEEGLPTEDADLHLRLYEALQQAESDDRDGVWARIIKNAFAPLFAGGFDRVVGNPPWVNWEHLPADYRESTHSLWQSYGLFPHKGYQAKLGGAKDDLSILMTYVAHDRYLKADGLLGFVITQSIFKTKGGGKGFRSFSYRNKAGVQFVRPLRVDDLSKLRPFEDAANRTAVFIAEKTHRPVDYPVPYFVWTPNGRSHAHPESQLSEVLDSVNLLPELARPVDPNDVSSAWFTAPDGAYEAFERIRGASPYRARKGVYCATNAIYWLSSVEPIGANRVLVSNIADSGKRKVQAVTQPVEADFVHPLLRGKDVGRWKTRSELSILLPQQEGRPDKAVPESELRRKWPLTYAYFRQFEEEIRKCALLEQFFDQDKDAFYSSYNVGSYTFAPHKVVWREVAPEIQAAVVSTSVGPDPVPDHKLVCVACDTASAAHMLCAVLNSTPVRAFVRAYTVQTSISGHALEYIRVPAYLEGDGTHAELAALSKGCHETVDQAEIVVSEARIDELVRMMWGLSRKDLAAMSALLDD